MKKLGILILIFTISYSGMAQNANTTQINKAGKHLKRASGLYFASISLSTLGVVASLRTNEPLLPIGLLLGGVVTNLIAIGEIGRAGTELIYLKSFDSNLSKEEKGAPQYSINDRYYVEEIMLLESKGQLSEKELKKLAKFKGNLTPAGENLYYELKDEKEKSDQ